MNWRKPSVIFLTWVNLIPVIGIFFWGWNVITILMLYWLESVFIGLLNIPKILMCQGSKASKIFTASFFTLHYCGFAAGHLTGLGFLFGINPLSFLSLSFITFWIAAFSLFGFRYDKEDNLTEITDPRNETWKWQQNFDNLNRLKSEIDPDGGTTDYELSDQMDDRNPLKSVTDARSITTNYVRNGFGEVIREISAETGITEYSRDEAGRITQMTDGRGIARRVSCQFRQRLQAERQQHWPIISAMNHLGRLKAWIMLMAIT